jgi:uncharacterized protein
MPEYLAPGVYVEEVSFRSKSIEGLSTSTAGFIGPARYGPTTLVPQLLTSLGEFERIYGSGAQLDYQGALMENYLWHGVRAFFEEGGKRLYAQRVYRRAEYAIGDLGQIKGKSSEKLDDDGNLIGYYDEGVGFAQIPDITSPIGPNLDANHLSVQARNPGTQGNLRGRFILALGPNLLSFDENRRVSTASALQPFDIVFINDMPSPLTGSVTSLAGRFYQARVEADPVSLQNEWVFYDKDAIDANATTPTRKLKDLLSSERDEVRRVTLTVTLLNDDPFDLPQVWTSLPLDPRHTAVGSGAADDLTSVFAFNLANSDLEYRVPIVLTLGDNVKKSGLHVLDLLRTAADQIRPPVSPAAPGLFDYLLNLKSTDLDRSFDILLRGGNDGVRPTAAEYEGTDDPNQSYKTGLKGFEDMEDISIVAAPGHSFGYEGAYNANARTIQSLLIGHAERMRYRIAVLDSGNGQSIQQVRAQRAKIDSKYAALYYPWVRILDPITRTEIYLPPSGFVAGIYARNDINRAVYKAPANEVVNLALGFEQLLNKAQQDVLNPEGINCFRFFEGRGYRLWGARTISSDPEWKYVNLRRYFAYLEHSVDKGTQWAVFEPNGEALWANVRRTIEDFLLNEWQSGALLGDKPEKAYFVRCDRSTMTQNDLDNGRSGAMPIRHTRRPLSRSF